ncbi:MULTISPECIES: hypothetical protein [Micromonospora]|uniref:Guanylate cyclase n=1 Tax=Micromonospora yangpuensis TaxID=683228 RepID=A0A1C6UY44_9ACTN|nr:hypothetical protein [Micromonospora yangpuensis]GGL95062.1 hypothetical protein GCM10012279_10590 [Micromonospora yangpuensis]SCL58941.1 hypothetical protein GA0070617_3958 [Micromonospora yangpuensis]
MSEQSGRRGGTSISLDEAVELSRTGDVWVFRGRSVPDRAIQLTTNSPVNHVGMALVLDDMPPLMWHAELGRSLPDMWTGTHHRGVQLHDLRDAVCVWANRYGQRAWLRQLEPPADAEMEKAALRTVARLDGTPFPSTAQLAWRWARGRVPQVRLPLPGRWAPAPVPGRADDPAAPSDRALETAYCAEVVAVTYEAMGLLPEGRRPNWYDPGRFWSGDDLGLAGPARLGAEIEVRIPPR